MTFEDKIKNYEKKGFSRGRINTSKGAKWVLFQKERSGWSFGKSYDQKLLYYVENQVKIGHFNDFCNKLVELNNNHRFDEARSAIFLHTRTIDKKAFREVAKDKIPELYDCIFFTKISKTKKTQNKTKTKKRKRKGNVFVVHGHDEAINHHVARTISDLGLRPKILREGTSGGKTLIENIESSVNESDYAVVILSPDDEGKKKSERKLRPRARQNVVLELGILIGRLGRPKVFTLLDKVPNFETPSDIAGVIYTPYDKRGAWRFKLCDELKSCGFDVSRDDLS